MTKANRNNYRQDVADDGALPWQVAPEDLPTGRVADIEEAQVMAEAEKPHRDAIELTRRGAWFAKRMDALVKASIELEGGDPDAVDTDTVAIVASYQARSNYIHSGSISGFEGVCLLQDVCQKELHDNLQRNLAERIDGYYYDDQAQGRWQAETYGSDRQQHIDEVCAKDIAKDEQEAANAAKIAQRRYRAEHSR